MAARLALFVGLGAVTLGCDRKTPALSNASATASAPRAPVPSMPSSLPSARRTALLDAAVASARVDAAAPSASDHGDAGRASRFLIKAAEDVGPAGAGSATSTGVLFLTATDELRAVDLAHPEPVGAALATALRPPAIAGNAAYWVSHGRLVRRALTPPATLETLATDALNRRVSALESAGTPIVAYLAKGSGGDSVAKVWAPDERRATLTPAGASASSVALATRASASGRIGEVVALALEGRSAMSPVHARPVHLTKTAIELGEDTVIWIGGSAQASTEVHAASSLDGKAVALIPIERTATEFGLAQVLVPETGQPGSDPTWLDYLNGLEPATVASGTLCGTRVVLYAEPRDKAPRAPQILRLGVITSANLESVQVVAEAGAFSAASLAESKLGGIIAYVADGRTWAASVRCRQKSR